MATMTFGIAVSYIFYAVAPTWDLMLVGAVLGSLPHLPAGPQRDDRRPAAPRRRGAGYSTIMFTARAVSLLSPVIAGILYLNYGLVTGMRIAT